ncbi:MAG TPA: AAA family ATPase [Pyrinomonadaceae bacterium]|nr:AAA family ATPase [Pyrinomonadaceae bacterium]
MLLTNAQVKMFKSIEDSEDVSIDDWVTVLVGQNEAGKTAFLQALYKAKSIDKDVSYDVTNDYPRKSLTSYEKRHKTNPDEVAVLKYKLQNHEREELKTKYGLDFPDDFRFTITHKYNDSISLELNVSEIPYLKKIIDSATLSAEVRAKVSNINTVINLITTLNTLDLNTEETSFLNKLKEDFNSTLLPNWSNKLQAKIWKEYLSPKIPKFLYFDDYYLLPGKVNLPALKMRVDNETLKEEDKTILGLLQMADVELEDVITTSGYEKSKARLEGISNSITDRIFEFWKQNQNLEVSIDIKEDPEDESPFNNGNNLYIRIKNQRHRVTVPFSQRSKGFIWFFSFIVWFDAIKEQLETNDDLVILLDEPGLSLHALGQADLLRYIDYLAENHQIIYTTHSPFMVHGDRLHQTRTVQDREKGGTKISDNVSSSDSNTLFPLQAALGYTIAQNLFISAKNLLVEGPADLIYLKFFSGFLEKNGRTHLREDITIVPVGGLDKLSTFVALLAGNELEIVVLHDYESKPNPHLETLVREKLIRGKQVLNYAMFRQSKIAKTQGGSNTYISSDVEDIISPDTYLKIFNATYKKELGGTVITEKDLPTRDRIVKRIEQYLSDNAIQLKPSGGFNHYLVASYLASNPPTKVDANTLTRFETLFEKVNNLFLDE